MSRILRTEIKIHDLKLNINFCSIKEIPIKPVYEVGEQSKMKIIKVIPRIFEAFMASSEKVS